MRPPRYPQVWPAKPGLRRGSRVPMPAYWMLWAHNSFGMTCWPAAGLYLPDPAHPELKSVRVAAQRV